MAKIMSLLFIFLILYISVTRSFPINNASPMVDSVLDAMAVGSPKGIGQFKQLESGNSKNWQRVN